MTDDEAKKIVTELSDADEYNRIGDALADMLKGIQPWGPFECAEVLIDAAASIGEQMGGTERMLFASFLLRQCDANVDAAIAALYECKVKAELEAARIGASR